MTYTYDPLKIKDRGKDQMRFEIGDTFVEGGSDTCVLSDEEYEGMLSGIADGVMAWKKAKLSILKAILFKLSYQVDTKIDVLQYNFSDRADRWEKLYKDLKEEVSKTASVPIMSTEAMKKPPYFYAGMKSNCRSR